MRRNPLMAGLRPTHPGQLLREDVLPAIGRPKAEIARLLGVSRPTLYEILNEKQPVTASMAIRIGKLLGTSAESWLRMQQEYDLGRIPEIAEAMEPALAAIPKLEMA